MVDASFVDVPRQRNNRDDNDKIKAGGVPTQFGKNKHTNLEKTPMLVGLRKAKKPILVIRTMSMLISIAN